ncbi:MAG: DUF2062 domain-containing protein [Verrucomicrobiales bacterium]|nr:DUF2062 domain-containing protein [Verrucomicrobiales bacterium]
MLILGESGAIVRATVRPTPGIAKLMSARLFIKATSRKIYRFFRHPRHRRAGAGRLRRWMGENVFEREMWRPCELTVARGIGLGLLVAVFPVPGQMFAGGLLAIFMTRRWDVTVNLPATIIGTWANNPVTFSPVLYAQMELGKWLIELMGLPAWPTPALEVAQPVVLGVAVTAVLVPVIGFVAVIGLWDLVLRYLSRRVATVDREEKGRKKSPADVIVRQSR